MFQAGQWSRTYEIFVGGREEEEGRRVRRLMDGACDSLGHRGGRHGGSDGMYGRGVIAESYIILISIR